MRLLLLLLDDKLSVGRLFATAIAGALSVRLVLSVLVVRYARARGLFDR